MLSHRNTWNVSFVNLCSDMETPITPLSGMEYFTPASHQTFIRTSLAQTNLGRCRLSVVWLALIHDNMTTIMTWSWQQYGWTNERQLLVSWVLISWGGFEMWSQYWVTKFLWSNWVCFSSDWTDWRLCDFILSKQKQNHPVLDLSPESPR